VGVGDRSEGSAPGTSRSGRRFVERRSGARLRTPALTILWYPELQRVGERARLRDLLSGLDAPVSRSGPPFRDPGGGPARPLDHAVFPSDPFRLVSGSGYGAIRLERGAYRGSLSVEGTPVGEEIELSGAEVEQGVVLEIGESVLLMLHHLPAEDQTSPVDYGLVGESESLVELRREVRRVADLAVPVLLRGETGTGKELLARAIHLASRRREQTYLSINLGAIPGSLAASELFGAAKGSYTGSVRSHQGYFLRADGGTLFLDEVAEAPPEVQVMLLRVLETGEVQPLGVQGSQRVDVRLIAATDGDLEAAADEGSFKAPLLHRLSGYEIVVPPLRERRDDFGRLLVHFLREELEQVGEERRLEGDPSRWLPISIVARLACHDWPGNIRQLKNMARQLVIGSRGSETVRIGPQLERLLQEASARRNNQADSANGGGEGVVASQAGRGAPGGSGRPAARERYRDPSEITQEELIEALRSNRWAVKPSAEALGVSRTSLYALIERCPAVRKASDLDPEEILSVSEQSGGDLNVMSESLEVSVQGLRQRMKELGLE